MTSLTSTHSGHRPCPGDTIIFTCITNGSSSHAWRSDEYIGVGGIQLEFATFDNPGVIRTPSNNPASSTLARLVAVGNREQRVLQSKLELTVTADYNKSTISCINVDRNLTNKTTIEILGTHNYNYCFTSPLYVYERPLLIVCRDTWVFLMAFLIMPCHIGTVTT